MDYRPIGCDAATRRSMGGQVAAKNRIRFRSDRCDRPYERDRPMPTGVRMAAGLRAKRVDRVAKT